MKTSSAKGKGRRLQQLVRDAILKVFEQLTLNDVRSTGMGQTGVDIQLSEAALKLFPYSVECKNVEKLNVWKVLEDAKKNEAKDTTTLVIIKKNRTEAYAVIPFEHFMELLNGQKKT